MPNVILNDVVQVVPGHDLEGCLLIVTKITDESIEGILETYKWGRTKINLYHSQYQRVGSAPFVFYKGDDNYGTP